MFLATRQEGIDHDPVAIVGRDLETGKVHVTQQSYHASTFAPDRDANRVPYCTAVLFAPIEQASRPGLRTGSPVKRAVLSTPPAPDRVIAVNYLAQHACESPDRVESLAGPPPDRSPGR